MAQGNYGRDLFGGSPYGGVPGPFGAISAQSQTPYAATVTFNDLLDFTYLPNLDPTNYIEIYNSTSGTTIMKLLPGDPPFLFRFDPAITAPAAKAHTATCLMQYMILEN